MIQHLTILFLFPFLSMGQHDFSINGHHFNTVTEVKDNEWGTHDTIRTLKRVDEIQITDVLTYYVYKDEGGDCNNLFWNRGTLSIEGDSILLTTHYLQETGMDPIPEMRRQVFRVEKSGRLTLLSDKYWFRHSTEWEDE